MCWLDHPFYLIQNPNFEISDWFPSPYFQLSCLLYLFLLVLRLVAGTGALVAVDALHKIAAAIGGGVSVAKAHPWNGCSRVVNIVFFN
jgi:hypothetical protein